MILSADAVLSDGSEGFIIWEMLTTFLPIKTF